MSLPLVHHPEYVAPLPEGHRFPMAKFNMLHRLLIDEGVAQPAQFHHAPLAGRQWLSLVHDADYIDRFFNGTLDASALRRIGLPWSPALVRRTCAETGGTVLTAHLALEHGLACNTAGGTHHAHAGFGSGFCIFNDMAVATRVMQAEGLAQRVLLLDFDVHQGDGSAALFADDPTVITCSVHCEKNFPLHKPPSDVDIALPAGVTDDEYMQAIAMRIEMLLDGAGADLVIYDAGVDPHESDRLGRMALTDEGLIARDRWVLNQCLKRGLPVACVIGGGYSHDLEALTRRHSLLHRVAGEVHALRRPADGMCDRVVIDKMRSTNRNCG